MNSKKTCRFLIALLCLFLSLHIALPVSVAEQLIKPPKMETAEKRILRFKNPGGLQYLNERFLSLHPDVEFEYLDWDPNDTAAYWPFANPIEEFHCDVPEIPPIDIYILRVAEGLPRLIREGRLLDLSSSESILAAHSSYFPQAQEALSADGKPVAVPFHFYVCSWDYDEKTWNDLGLPSVPTSAVEIVNLLSRWGQDIVLPPEMYLYGTGGWYDIRMEVLMDVINMYVIENASATAPLNFDTPEFRNLLKKVVNLPPLPYRSTTHDTLLLGEDRIYPIPFTLTDLDSGWSRDNPNLVSLLPVNFSPDGPGNVAVEANVVCVAHNTQNRELALEYLEYILSQQDNLQEDLRAMLTANRNEMDALGIRKETQDSYSDLTSSMTFAIDALEGFILPQVGGELYYSMCSIAYDMIAFDGSPNDETTAILSAMQKSLDPLVTYLNETAQYYFTNHY